MIPNLLDFLFKINVISMIVEGGKETINSFLKLGYWNEARVIEGDKRYISGIKAPKLKKKWSHKKTIGNETIYTYFKE